MKYTCKCCNFETIFKRNYINHTLTLKHINNFKTNKYCDLCDKEYSTTKYFKIHYNKEHLNKNNRKKTNLNNNLNTTKSKNSNSNISYNKIKNIVDESNHVIKETVKDEINKSNYKVQEEIHEAKEEINKSNQEVVKVVNKAINRASSLIKYLMEHHQTTPPLKKIKQKESIELLRIDYKCPLNENAKPYELEKTFIRDYINDMFIKNICKSILNLVNYKNPDKQPIWNTDCTRYNYVIKTTLNKWSEDKLGIKFTDYVIKTLLHYIRDLICIYRTNELDKMNVKKFNSDQIRDHFTYLNNTYKLENDIVCDKLIKDILKELSPYLRYLETELEELEELEEKEKLDKEDDENEDEEYDEKNNEKKIEELEQIQDDLKEIVNKAKFNLDDSHDDYDNDSHDDSDNDILSDESSYDKKPLSSIYKKRLVPLR